MLQGQRARIAAITAAALFALFLGQPLHGAAATHASDAAAASFASDPGAATHDVHHAHACPLCRAANQTRAAVATAPLALIAATPHHLTAISILSAAPLRRISLCVSGPRAPPTPFSPLV